MGKRLKSTMNSSKSPFWPEFGDKVGAGQDNYVREFRAQQAAGVVVKISKQKGEALETAERAKESTVYKKKKYEILKRFLGEFVPKTSFVVGTKTEGRREPIAVPKSYTIQDRVPNVKISDLAPAQQIDPRLLRQMFVLVRKLQNLYLALDTANHAAGTDALDGKLDLGGISKFVRNEYDPRNFQAGEVIARFQNSPNLLVDPITMRLYCIDFDDGSWDSEKEAAKGILEHIADTDPDVQAVIALDPNMVSIPSVQDGPSSAVA